MTPAERFAVKFMARLEKNEEVMGEMAALAVTLGQFGLPAEDPSLIADIAAALPGEPGSEWWHGLTAAELETDPTPDEAASFGARPTGGLS